MKKPSKKVSMFGNLALMFVSFLHMNGYEWMNAKNEWIWIMQKMNEYEWMQKNEYE